MDEHVLAVFAAQKSKSLGVVKPLDCSLFHCVLLLFTDLPRTQCGSLRVGGNRNRQELQIEFYDWIECSTDWQARLEKNLAGWGERLAGSVPFWGCGSPKLHPGGKRACFLVEGVSK